MQQAWDDVLGRDIDAKETVMQARAGEIAYIHKSNFYKTISRNKSMDGTAKVITV